jgi:hypothetical protein
MTSTPPPFLKSTTTRGGRGSMPGTVARPATANESSHEHSVPAAVAVRSSRDAAACEKKGAARSGPRSGDQRWIR